MKVRKRKILSFICATMILFVTVFFHVDEVWAVTNETNQDNQTREEKEKKLLEEGVRQLDNKEDCTIINSQTLLQSSSLDTLVLNYTSLPNIIVSGSENYTIEDLISQHSVKVRQVMFPNAIVGKTLDSIITVKFNNCGKLNGKAIDMKLIYSDIVIREGSSILGDIPFLYWSAYGTSMATKNEWWYHNIEHVTVKVYFYDSGSSMPIPLNTAYLSIFSEGNGEGASSAIASNQYLYEQTDMIYKTSIVSLNTLHSYQNVFLGTTDGNTDSGILNCVSFQYQNTNHIQIELYSFNDTADVGYHLQYTSLTATIPDNPKKVVDKQTANIGESITYTITQDISKAVDNDFYYSSLVFKDVLDSNLTYHLLKVYDENGRDITSTAGVISYDSSSNTLQYIFQSNYLKRLAYGGQTYKFRISAKINKDISSGVINNSAVTIINNQYSLSSNKVITKVIYRVMVDYIDEQGKKLTDSETIIGYEGNSYKTEEKNIYGYELKEVPTNNIGTMKEETTKVTYVYTLKDTSVLVKYIDEHGNNLLDSVAIKGKVFDKYNTDVKDIAGYELIEVPKNNKGKMQEETIFVTYKYRLKNTSVLTKYIDEDGKEIADSKMVEGKVFDKYKTEKKKIDGYELLQVPENATGNMTEDNITVIYKYRKLKFNISVSKKLSAISLNGKNKNVCEKLEIDKKVMVDSFKLTYTITVSNTGEIAGTTTLYDCIPKGYVALKEENPNWIIKDGLAYIEVSNIPVGEFQDYRIVLTASSNEVAGIVVNTAICENSSCAVGFEESILTDNISASELIVSISTGLSEHRIEIIGGILIVLIVLIRILCKIRKNRKI